MRDLLILGTRGDPHNAWIEEDLKAAGAPRVFVLDFKESRFELSVSEKGEHALTIDGTRLKNDFLVWDSRAIVEAGTYFYVAGDDPEAAPSRAFAAEEWRFLYRLIGCLSGGVFNPLGARACLVKPRQQVVAAQCGLRVPATLVTNERKAMVAFEGSADGPIIMKSLSSTKIPLRPTDDQAHYSVLTMRVSPEDLASATNEDVGYCPHFVQREIEKDHELRVVWVDGTAMAFRVESQRYRSSAVDWRKFSRYLDFEPCSLAADIERKIGDFMRTMRLFSGSLDVIVDKQGEHWFLECNSGGAWGWLDESFRRDELRKLFATKIYDRLQAPASAAVLAESLTT